MLGYILASVAVLAVLVVLVLVVLPSRRSARHTVHIAAPPMHVLALLNDLANQPRWRPDVAAVTVHSPTEWTEVLAAGPHIRFTRPGVWAGTDLTCRMAGDGFTGTWTAQLVATAGGTTLHLHEQVDYHRLPAKLFGYTLARVEALTATYAAQLKAAAERPSAKSDQ